MADPVTIEDIYKLFQAFQAAADHRVAEIDRRADERAAEVERRLAWIIHTIAERSVIPA